MILGRDNPSMELFDPSRFKPVTSARDFIRENLNVAKEFMSDCISTPQLDDLGELSPGTCEVVEWKGERVAVYKDEEGKVFSCSAACTHMGCIVHWNGAEKSWNCPCHGSRFNYDGKVIQLPANRNLESKQLKAESEPS